MALRRTGFSEESKRKTREKQLAKQREGRPPIKRKKTAAPKQRGRQNGHAHDIITQAEIDAKRRFRLEAAGQKHCARCGLSHDANGDPLPWDAHHVVERQWLKQEGFNVIEQYDPDNALRLCGSCHSGHTDASARVYLSRLKMCNLRYAFRIMGPRAGYYLRRRYRGEDERLDQLEQQHE